MSPARLWLFIRILLLCILTIGAAGLGCTTVAPRHPRVATTPTTAQSPGVEAAPPFSSPTPVASEA
jgi:hypothetical protein